MYLNMKLNRFVFVVSILTIWSCANRVPPSGGPKDTTPPKLLGSIPKSGSTNVKTQDITLLFDELVVIKNIKKELLITPRIESDYTYKTKKNTVILTLEEPLDSATTYTFNFRDAVGDITEGNPVKDLIIAFSTGEVLDTLELSGDVADLFTEKPQNEMIVGLYKANDTLDLFNSPPYYLAQTNKKGAFTFRNIKSDSYKLYAFHDKNNNLICESDREGYAFQDSLIKLDSNSVAKTLKLQKLNIDSLELKRTRSSGKYFYAVTNKGLVSAKLAPSNDSTLWYSYGDGRKEIKLYNTFNIADSLLIQLTMMDSLYQTKIDSFYISFPETQRSSDEFKLNSSDILVSPEKKEIQFKVNATKPLKIVNSDSIHIAIDTIANINFDSTWNISFNNTKTEFTFKNTLPEAYLDSIDRTEPTAFANRSARPDPSTERGPVGKTKTTSKSTFNLIIPTSTFISIESDSSQQIESQLKPRYLKDFGILMGSISTQYHNYSIQLLDKDFNVIEEKGPAKNYKFSFIPPGDYSLRILIDENNNGRWDAGNILLNLLPEPIFIYKNAEGTSKTSIRANWELTLDLAF